MDIVSLATQESYGNVGRLKKGGEVTNTYGMTPESALKEGLCISCQFSLACIFRNRYVAKLSAVELRRKEVEVGFWEAKRFVDDQMPCQRIPLRSSR